MKYKLTIGEFDGEKRNTNRIFIPTSSEYLNEQELRDRLDLLSPPIGKYFKLSMLSTEENTQTFLLGNKGGYRIEEA